MEDPVLSGLLNEQGPTNEVDWGMKHATTPPFKNITGSFFVCELISLALPEKSVMWLPEIIPGELIVMDYRKVWPGLTGEDQ